MILPLLQIALLTIVALYLARWRENTRRKSVQSWDSLIARLRPDWSARDLSDHFLWKEGVNVTPEETWTRIRGAQVCGPCIRMQKSCWKWPTMPHDSAKAWIAN